MLDEELLKKYKAKPDKSIFEHNQDLKKQKDVLINLGYLNNKEKIELLSYAIDYHDSGKINFKFQKRIEENIKRLNGEKYNPKYLKFDKENEIEHNILSAFLINSQDFNSEDEYLSVLYSVVFHHRYSDAISTINNQIFPNIEEILEDNLPKGVVTYEGDIPLELNFQDLNTVENIKLLGLLIKCDHSASGGYEIEYPNDFLEDALNNLLNEFKEKLATLSYSKIILDEMQMYDASLLAAVIFGITKIIEMGGKIAIVTATFPPIIEYFLNKYLMKGNKNVIKDLDKPEEIVEEPIFIKKKFTNNEKIRHNIVLIDDEIRIEQILWQFKKNRKENKKSNKILVICNTIKKAQEIYLKLKEEDELKDKISMLHSNFIREDRENKEKEILDFGKTEFDGEGIWISTSLVEASLDIDFDYLFTELQDLNSLFQRFGRCNRKGKKSVDEANCFIYLKIEDKYLKEKGSKYGFIDKDIYENSKKGLENYCKVISKDEIENSQDYSELLKNYSKKITEGDKIKLIEENLSFENLKESNFVDEFEKTYEKYQRILNSDENSQDDLKLRDIQSVTVIPYNIYEENKENIKELIKKIEDKNLGLEERQKAKTELLKKTLSIQYYQLSKYISEILKGKADANKYKSESINKFEKITVMEADYDKELGFHAKDFKDGVPTYEFI